MHQVASVTRILSAAAALALLWTHGASALTQPTGDRIVNATPQATTPPATQATTQPSARPKVIVVPIQGPLYYQMTTGEMNKIVRGATVQKPEAVILLISSPGGSKSVAFEVAEQIADLPAKNVVAFVTGEGGGVFGPAVVPLLACRRVFIAPENTIDPGTDTNDTSQPAADVSFTPRQVSLLRSWTAQHQVAWEPIERWFRLAGVIAVSDQDAPVTSTDVPTKSSDSQVAEAARAARAALKVTQAEDLDDVLDQLGLAGAWVITWPDPVTKSNEQMQRIFETADGLVKIMNASMEAARKADPRAYRYELRDISREYTTGSVNVSTRPAYSREFFKRTETVTDHDLFADDGQAWRDYTDRCTAQVRKAMETNRNLIKLAARYPEINIDTKDLNETYEMLSSWLNQLKMERNLRSPP